MFALASPNPTARVFTAADPPAPMVAGSLSRYRGLVLASPEGTVAVEAIAPADVLRDAGATVYFATIGGDGIVVDPLSDVLAPVIAVRARSELRQVMDLRRLLATRELDAFLAGIDAVLVPGGHGARFAEFVRDPLLHRVLAQLAHRGAVLGLQCHAVLAGALATDADGVPLLSGREVTCWPRAAERPLGHIPVLGRWLAPFDRAVEDGVAEVAVVHPVPRTTAVADGRVVTTWGPWTGVPFARAVGGRMIEAPPRSPVQALPAPMAPIAAVRTQRSPLFRNWARNFSCRPDTLAHPATTEEVAAVVQRAIADGKTVRAVGSGYSYTRLAQTDAVMICLDQLTGLESIDEAAEVARVRAGTPLHALTRLLAKRGWALPVMGDIDRQTIGGVVATATHGTGLRHGSFSSLVRGLTLVDGRGVVRHLGPDDPELHHARASFGAFGVVTHVDVQVVRHYHLEVVRWADELHDLLPRLGELARRHRNFEFFWFPGTPVASCRAMDEVPAAPGGSSLGRFLNEVVVENGLGWLASELTYWFPAVRRVFHQLGARLIASERSVRPAEDAYVTPRLVRHQEIEYALPIEAASAALLDLEAMFARHPAQTLFPVEVRFAPGEDVPMSPAYGRDTVWIAAHTWIKEDHTELFDRCEQIFLRHGGRPHWGKLHGRDRDDLAPLYAEWKGWQAARDAFDPDRVFANPYVARLLGA